MAQQCPPPDMAGGELVDSRILDVGGEPAETIEQAAIHRDGSNALGVVAYDRPNLRVGRRS
jgi:hypothetical protein